jgi:hypothetical protein
MPDDEDDAVTEALVAAAARIAPTAGGS